MTVTKRLLILMGLCGFFLLLTGCVKPPLLHLTIQDHAWTKEYNQQSGTWRAEITGHAINDGDVAIGYGEIWAKFYDANDDLVWEWYDEVKDLAKDEIYQFSIVP